MFALFRLLQGQYPSNLLTGAGRLYASQSMPLLALIVSADDHDIRLLREVLHELHVETNICETAEMAACVLGEKPVDAVVLDGDLPGVLELIDTQARREEGDRPRIIAVLS